MAMSPIKPTEPQKSNRLIGENYMRTLSQSIQDFLTEKIHQETPNLSHFIDSFYELMQSNTDPPLEAIWVYSALSFRSREITNGDLLDRVLNLKALFQFISGCSSPCSASKGIALLAPVVYEMHKVIAELLSGNDLGAKRVKKVMKEVKSLIDVILGYISVCCCKDLSKENDSSLIVPVADLVSVWMDGNEGLKSFLPHLSSEISEEIGIFVCSINYLAGAVIAEVFLVKLCVDLWAGNRGVQLEKELRSWIVGSITGFQSFYFFEIIVSMLLEPTLPVTSLLSSEDEVLLRTILYDAVVLVEYSFLCPKRTNYLAPERVRGLAMKRLILTHKAVEFFSKNGNQARSISYSSFFSNSRLLSQIIKCFTSHFSMDEEASRLNGSSPKALIKWLQIHDSEVIRVFGDSISRSLNKLGLGVSKPDSERPESRPRDKKLDVDLLTFIGEEEETDEDDEKSNDSMSAALLAAAHTTRSVKSKGKRKEQESVGKKKRIKSIKHELSDKSDSDKERSSSVSNDSSSSESEVENPISDDDN